MRTLRLIAAALVVAVVVVVTGYGVGHPARAPADLVNAIIRGMDDLSGPLTSCVLCGYQCTGNGLAPAPPVQESRARALC